MSDRLGWVPIFKTNCDIIMSCEFLAWFQKIGSHSRTHDGCHVSTSRSRHDNFIGISSVDFLNPRFIFTSPVDIGCVLINA